MADSRDHSALRTLVGEVVAGLGSLTHRELNPAFERLGMPPVPDDAGSKRDRIELSQSQVPDAELPQVTRRILEQSHVHVSPSIRYQLEDLLWAEDAPPEIPKKARRELARALGLSELTHHHDRFMRLLDRFWIAAESDLSFQELEGLLLKGTRPVTLRDRIERHVFRNPGDWSTEDLFENLGVFEAGDARFARFLEGLVSADVLLDEHLQGKAVSIINGHLRTAGVELRVTGSDGGYPLFTKVSMRLHGSRRPKNIIFASLEKPDIRFRSSVDNDIEIVGGRPDATLVYDREIPATGLRWRDLHSWWQDTRKISSEADVRTDLYQRLLKSLPANSPGQRNLFMAYQTARPPSPDDPALLPEVWLHWDHRTVQERGPEALLRSRMDFLLLLPHGQRVVLEVDGSQHYTRDHGRTPDTAKYADTVAADRDLKLRGYEVFRFGHDELKRLDAAQDLLRQFIPDMFRRFRVSS
ncbi:AbiJ-related protein [Streptomyces europaeiscabiei]|uniref:AbiJ-related protein n=1 Tax=Streptomyces europaeiscabiei TaxID=146819 RepID=UPI0038F7F9CF